MSPKEYEHVGNGTGTHTSNGNRTPNGNTDESPTVIFESDTSEVRLEQSLGLFNGIAIILGTIVGSGIFVSPTGVLIESGSVGLALIIWVACGLMCLLGALCFAELGTLITKSGGLYAYIHECFGDLAGFLCLWVSLIVLYPAGNAIIALTFGYYCIQPLYPDCELPDPAVRLIAALVIALLTFINSASVKWAARVQDIFTIIKTITLVLIIATGVYVLAQGKCENFSNPFEGSTVNIGKISLAFYSGLFSYSGWYTLNFLTEELKEPYRNLPRAIWVSMPLVTIIYLLTNIAYFAVLNTEEIIGSDAVAMSFALRVFGKHGWFMPICVALSTFGCLNGCIMSSSRMFFVGARQGHLPDSLALICLPAVTPLPAVVIQGIISIAMLVTSDVYLLINFTTFIETAIVLFCTVALLQFRRSRPNAHRPIKVSLILPVVFLIVCIFLVIVPLYQDPIASGVGILITLTGLPVYLICVVWNKPHSFRNKINVFTIATQKLIMGVQPSNKID